MSRYQQYQIRTNFKQICIAEMKRAEKSHPGPYPLWQWLDDMREEIDEVDEADETLTCIDTDENKRLLIVELIHVSIVASRAAEALYLGKIKETND